jgi:hypothetical protein
MNVSSAALDAKLVTHQSFRSPLRRYEQRECSKLHVSTRASTLRSIEQRRTAVPRLLDFADDGALDAETRTWVFQALRDITGQTLPHDATRWRQWFATVKR